MASRISLSCEIRKLAPLFLLPWAVEQKAFAFTQTEISCALTQLAGLAKADDEEESEEDDDDAASRLVPFQDFSSLTSLTTEYIDPNIGADQDRKKMPSEKRIELLARILPTADQGLQWIAVPESNSDQYLERTSAIWESTNGTIRTKENMPNFHMPEMDWHRLVSPNLGLREFDGKTEHIIEKWLQVLYLLRYASGKIAKSWKAGRHM